MTPLKILSDVSTAVILVMAALSARELSRHRTRQQLHIFGLVAALAIVPYLDSFGIVGKILRVGVLLALPYFLLQLVAHFRDVSKWIQGPSLAAIPAGIAAFILFPGWGNTINPPVSAELAILAAYAAAAFVAEARRTSGVTAKRLTFAAVGTWMFAADFALSSISFVSFVGNVGGGLTPLFSAALAVSYFFAFNTPRGLRTRWQGVEQAKYLSFTADRDPEDRGRAAGADLNRAAARSIANAAVLVALRDSPSATTLTVQASTTPSLVGLSIVPAGGVVGRLGQIGATALAAASAACEPELAERISPLGTQLLAAPVATTTQVWGVVLVVQRHGSLFPDDDLRLLAQLGRYAGTALDHAHLVFEAQERERRAADRRLREAESRMSLMLDSIKDYAMFVLDSRGRIVTWQVGAEHVFGYSTAEITEESAAPLYGMTQADFEALLGEARRFGRAEREAPCRRRDGSKFIGATTIRTLESDENDLTGFVAVTHDVTDRRTLEDRLRQGQKMEAIGRLAGGIAHDFNNQLLAISGYAELLAQELAGDALKLQTLAEVQKAADRATGLTRQLLAFSRQQILQPVPINLTRLVADLVPMLRRVIAAHIDIADETDANVAPVLGDRSQLEQVILNLALNARDAMPMGGRLTIRTGSTWLADATQAAGLPTGAYVCLEVADTGVGMDTETQARIFEPFFTTKEFGRGTGLGLATVYGIVQQMSGAVRVESQPQQGTTFRLYFPQAPDRKPQAVVDRPPAVGTAGPGGTETILLVEDEEAVRTFLARTLQRHGYRVITADNSASALAMAQAHIEQIHLVITDVLLPGGTGPEMIKTLAKFRPGLPALFISGYADSVIAQQGPFAKANHFLQKPFSTADLLLRVRQVIDTA